MTHQEILSKIDWEVKKQERFLNLVGRANRMKPKDRDVVLKNALWIDGTVEGQVQYCLRKLSMPLQQEIWKKEMEYMEEAPVS